MLIGLVGKPSVGKSTFFKASTLAEVEIASYPFTTIKPNHGVGYVKVECIEKEFGVKCNPQHGFCLNGSRFVPIDLMDVAGLVQGASEGKGLGNKFLDDLRQADVFIHIVDASGMTDEGGKQLSTAIYDPCNDVLFLEDELNKWFFNIMIKVWKSFVRKAEQEAGSGGMNFAQAVAKQFSGLKVKENDVKDVLLKLSFAQNRKPSQWTEEEIMKFSSELRKHCKPMIIAANKADAGNANENIQKLQNRFPDYMIYPCSADSELALRQASKAGLIEYIPGEDDFKVLKPLADKQKAALDKIKKEVLDVYQGTGVQEVLNMAVLE
ncbi:MAG: YchF-related putative GTPase, partial [Candidatus Pacearchaeota archaeon]